jgi:hypothetical protein
MKKSSYKLLLIVCIASFARIANAQDKNLYVFLCFGQSNMEGHVKVGKDHLSVDQRFKVLQAVDCPDSEKLKGEWYAAQTPLARCNTGLGPADYFGRTLTALLPDSISIGIINVSVGGSKIELFIPETQQAYAASAPDWMKGMIAQYDGDPYGTLIELGKIAQQSGVIKGILLHQGESNTGDETWPDKVNKVYSNIIADLALNPAEVPLLAGELVSAEKGGKCASMNPIINKLPSVIPNSHVVSSAGCEAVPDGLHFSAEGYALLGTRYAALMYKQLNK